MKKTFFTVVAMALMLISMSGYKSDNAGVGIGEIAPALSLSNGTSSVDLTQMQGSYVLLTFWSSSDAASRIDCCKYDAWVKAEKPQGLCHVCVNFDQEKVLFEEIAKRDGLNLATQYNVEGRQAQKIADDYKLASGYGSMLIGPDGRIIEYNPSREAISSL